jgi:hypothetical protein
MIARVLLGCAALGVLSFLSLADEPKEMKLKPVAVFRGSHSAIDRETFAVVSDEKEWKSIWEKHRGDEKTLRFTERVQYFDIDFDTQYVVAVFPADGDECLITPRRRGDEVAIGFLPHFYGIEGRQPGMQDTRSAHDKAKERAIMPYAFAVLPKPVKTVVIEKDIRRDKFAAPEWKEVKRFPTPKDNK